MNSEILHPNIPGFKNRVMPRRVKGLLNRTVFAVGILCAPLTPVASHAETSTSTTSARSSLHAIGCKNLIEFGGDPTAKSDTAPALRAAFEATEHTTLNRPGGCIFVPPGTYKLVVTDRNALDVDNPVRIIGSGLQNTVFVVEGEKDAFHCSKSPPEAYLVGCNLENFSIEWKGDPASGAAIHFNRVNRSVVSNVLAYGAFTNFWIEGSLNTYFSNVQSGGRNRSPGSALWRFNFSGGHNANIHVNGAESFGIERYAYDDGVVVNDGDGIFVSNFHVGNVRLAAIRFQPQKADDFIDDIQFNNIVIDPAEYGVLCEGEPVRYSGNFGQISITGGSVIHAARQDGFHNNCPHMHDVNLGGTVFLNNGRSGFAATAGSYFNLSGARFNGSNAANLGAPHVQLSGKANHVILDGASFSNAIHAGAAHRVPYDIVIAGDTDYVSGRGMFGVGAENRVRSTSRGRAIQLQWVSE